MPTGTHNGIGTHIPTVGTHVDTDGLTVAEAAVALGVSVNTIRRWIKDGRVRSERVGTLTGYAYRVFPEGVPINGTHTGNGTHSGTDQPVSDPSVTVALETHRAEAIAVYTRTLLEPLVARLAEQETTIRDQAETIGGLTAQVGNRERELVRQGAELEQARAKLAAAESSRRREHRRLRIGLAVAGALAVAAVVAPAWMR